MSADLSRVVPFASGSPNTGATAWRIQPLSVETVTTEAGFAALRTSWDELAQVQSHPHPFLRPAWFRAWWAAFGQDARLAIRVVRRGTRIVGILPLAERRISYLGLPVRGLVSLTNDHTNRFDLLLAPGPRTECKAIVEALWGEVLNGPTWDVLLLQACPVDSHPMTWLLEAVTRRGYRFASWEGARSPYLHLGPDKPPIANVLSAHRRSDLRRRRGQLERRLGPLRLERVTGPAQLAGALSTMFAIEATGWKGAGSSAMASTPSTERFYSEVAREAADRGTLSIDFLVAGDTRIAFGYHLVVGSTWYLLKTGYHAAYARYAPGFLFLCDLFRRLQAEANGTIEYDFLGQDDAYKVEWTPLVRRHRWWYVFPPRWKSQALRTLKFTWLPWARRVIGRVTRPASVA